MTKPVVQFAQVSKKFSFSQAIQQVHFQIEKGGITGVIGPNGSGKTTILNLIAGLIQPSSGTVKVCGEKPTRLISRYVSFLSDRDVMYPFYNATEMVQYISAVSGDFDADKAFRMFADLQFDIDKKARYLSKGNRAKLRMVLTLCRNTSLYVMDEPLSGLDPIVREDLLRLLVKYIELDEQTVIMSTHEVAEVEPVLDRVLFIKEGSVLFHRSMEEIREQEGKSLIEMMRMVTT